jgi:MFS transporter, OFA family, oxalate/formate antiporter
MRTETAGGSLHRLATASSLPMDAHPREGHLSLNVRLVMAGVAANVGAGTLFAWSLVADQVAADVRVPSDTVSTVFAAALVTFTVVLLIMGRGLRRFGPRRLLVGAAVGAGGGLLLTASWHHPLALWCGIALLFGAANGIAYGVAAGLAARVPQPHRGMATGTVVAAYAAGPVLLGFIAVPALSAVGWRTCLAVVGLTAAGLLMVAASLVPASTAEPSGPRGGSGDCSWWLTASLWLIFAGGSAPGLMVFAHAAPLATARGLDAATAGWAVSTLAAGNLAGRLIAGWCSDRTGRLPALATALVASAACVGALAAPVPPGVVLVAYTGVGLAYGAVSALVPAATADRVGAPSFPHVYGRVFTAWGCAGLAAPVAGEPLVRAAAESSAPLAWAALPLLPAALALLLLAAARPAVDVTAGGSSSVQRPGGMHPRD